MITDAMEQLRAMTSTAAARENEETSQRSSFRAPIRNWSGVVETIIGPTTVMRGSNSRSVLALRVNSLSVSKAITPYTSDSIDLEMAIPKQANKHAEVQLMVDSAAEIDPSIDSVVDLVGKRLTCEETAHKYAARENTGIKGSDGKDIWQATEFTTFYYKVVGIGATSANGAKAPAATTPDPAVLTAVLQYVSGITKDAFELGVLKEVPGAAADVAIRTSIINGKFLGEQVDAGKLTIDADGVYALA